MLPAHNCAGGSISPVCAMVSRQIGKKALSPSGGRFFYSCEKINFFFIQAFNPYLVVGVLETKRKIN